MKPVILLCVFVIFFLSGCSVTSKTAKQDSLIGTWEVSNMEGDVNQRGGGEFLNSRFIFKNDSLMSIVPKDYQGNADELPASPYRAENGKLFMGGKSDPLGYSFENNQLVLVTPDSTSIIFLLPIKDK